MTTNVPPPLKVGTANREITPLKPMFLVGYPHVPRTSTGVHDPIYATATCMIGKGGAALFVTVDICYIMPETSRACRRAIREATGIPEQSILISCTHTHSAPLTADILAWRADPVVPKVDEEYLRFFSQRIIEAAVAAWRGAVPARVAVTRTEAHGVGRNRLSPTGPMDHEVGIICARREDNDAIFAFLLVYSMHPTVLHEDSTLVSSDFPHYARAEIQGAFPGAGVAYHNGTSGNLSPRYEVRGQNFREAERLGRALGNAVVSAVTALRPSDFRNDFEVAARNRMLSLPPIPLPTLGEAEEDFRRARAHYEKLKTEGAGHGPTRTAECVCFGKEFIVRCIRSGEHPKMLRRYDPAEVQVFRLGDHFLVGLPGELFVEYGLEIKKRAPAPAFVITMANSELQGYIVTPEARKAMGYEATFSTFLPAAGTLMADTAVELMKGMVVKGP